MKKGFTLIEVLIVIVAGTLVLTAIFSVYVVNSRSYRQSVNQQELAQNARISLERMSRDIRQAERMVTSLPPTATDQLNPPPDAVQFQDGHETTKIQYIKYYKQNQNLKRQVLHYSFTSNPTVWVSWTAQDQLGNPPTEHIDEDVVKAEKISALKFYGNKVIDIEMQVQNNADTFNFRTRVWGRNIQ